MYRGTLAFGRKGLAIMAISGVDLALWDLQGRITGRPIADLPGGRPNEPLPTYRTLFPGETADDPQLKAFQALKLHSGGQGRSDPSAIAERVASAREAVGPDTDAGCLYGLGRRDVSRHCKES